MLQGPGVDPSQVASDVATQVDPQRRFIRTAQAQFQVKDVYRTALAIEDEVASQGGFVVDNEDAAVKACHAVDTLDRRLVRRTFEARFSAPVMARHYLDVYRKVIAQDPRAPALAPVPAK